MTIEEIKSLKDKVYEIEGLLELAQLREDKIPELEPLIKERIENLLEPAKPEPVASVGTVASEVPVASVRKPAFCLNDRFRFRRELFGNSDAEFAAAMNQIAAMENYDEAEEYFIGQLGWDPENQEVTDFMEIIRGYFE